MYSLSYTFFYKCLHLQLYKFFIKTHNVVPLSAFREQHMAEGQRESWDKLAVIENAGIRKQPFWLLLSFFPPYIPFSRCVLTPCWVRAENDILFGSWQHHLERKMKRDGDNRGTHAFAHTSCWSVHPTLFTGQFSPCNLRAELKWREKTKIVR